MTLGELTNEVAEIIKAKIYAGEKAERDWIVQEFALRLNGDTEAWQTLGREELKDMVERIIRRQKVLDPRKTAGQIEMTAPGYEYLQRGYSIERDETPLYVPIEQMTQEEGFKKRDEHRAAGDGHHAHARELHEYFTNRGDAAPATAASA